MWQRSSIANTFTLIKTIPKIHFTIPSHSARFAWSHKRHFAFSIPRWRCVPWSDFFIAKAAITRALYRSSNSRASASVFDGQHSALSAGAPVLQWAAAILLWCQCNSSGLIGSRGWPVKMFLALLRRPATSNYPETSIQTMAEVIQVCSESFVAISRAVSSNTQ